MKKIYLLMGVMLLTSCTTGTNEVPNTGTDTNEASVVEETQNETVSMDVTKEIDAMKESLSDSPRHQEWVEIDNNGKTIHAFVVYPEEKVESAAVIMIHENKGLNDWARSAADQIAAEGHIVIAPDMLSSFDETRQKTSDFASPDDATQALYTLDQDDIDSDMTAVAEYAKSIDSFNGNLVSAGFCWGGTQSYNLAAENDVQAAIVFYGTGPKDTAIYDTIDAPIYAFYGENDERVNSTIEATETYMTQNERIFEYEIYPGAGHAFMRNAQTEGADEATIEARDDAFERLIDILSEYK